MTTELQLLREIKENFDWPVDLFRYGLMREKRYLGKKGEFNELTPQLKERVALSLQKIALANAHLKLLTYIPWVKMVFLTGSVASLNATAQDDIDVWLIVEPRRIWITRAIDFFLYTFTGHRRLSIDGVDQEKVKNKFCFNFYTVTDHLELPTQNASFAMQFVDAIPLYVKDSSDYKALIEKNVWIERFFPTWYVMMCEQMSEVLLRKDSIKRTGGIVIDVIEYIAGVLMLAKSEKRIVLDKGRIFRSMFTTWGTPRILSRYDQEIISKSGKKGE